MSKRKWTSSMMLLSLGLALTAFTPTPATQPAIAAELGAHWSYKGSTGPEHWGDLSEAYQICEVGKQQSPINIDTEETTDPANDEGFSVKYKPALFTIANNGHTIQANATSTDNTLFIDGKAYYLLQFHFHTPSEHTINGKASPLEVHFVHKSADGQLAVLGILIKEGKASTVLSEMWSTLPKKETKTDIKLAKTITINQLLPSDKDSFRYAGSLTTPSCSEGIKWTVLAEPITMSSNQLKAFQAIFPNNSRPVQPVHDRIIHQYD
ncbi:carbonic anhydrase [Paenibacillus arenosi]|uniref:carbonic anhydrase n=1 Tax=Paenibacillus arenosi TaxID=2774142 RepID=A0ABR9AVA7_9BACL|nr:carbonic anhydrase family protein [Paenibacillus arenosi]MBD8498055.1 carbonic anhydrase family protein [Paenibacillus arenosi]